MALDFYLSKTKDVAGSSPRKIALEWDIHAKIFSPTLYSKYASIRKLLDFYSDAEYEFSELPFLIRDLETIKIIHDKNEVGKTISSLIEVCQEGVKKRLNLYAFAD